MTNTVTLCEDALDPSTWKKYEGVGDVRDFLMDRFGIWPDTARIYLEHVSVKSDITPSDEAGIERLGKLNGSNLFVVVYPEGITVILLIVAIVVAAVAITLVFLFRPNVKKPNNEDSPNNSLANRTNNARPLERIPDICGQLWATFDLLAVPYRTFENNIEVEHCYMCIGRGQYQMNASDIRDDITPSQQEQGNSVQVYGPGHNPNLGSVPDIQIGASIGERVYNVQQFGSVNGQILRAPNLGTILGNNNIRFVSPNLIQTNDPNIDFTKNFSLGDVLTVGGLHTNDALAVDSGGVQPSVDLSVQAAITGISSSQISLNNPAASNANWSALAAFAGGLSTYRSIDLVANGAFTVPQLTPSIPGFIILNPSIQQIWCNFVAPQGMYTIDTKGRQYGWGTQIQVTVIQCDSSGTPLTSPQTYTIGIGGNATDRLQKGKTLKIAIAPVFGFGGVIIYAQRLGNTLIKKGVTVVDEVQWRDCYLVSDPGNIDFGNITTVQTKTQTTLSATSVKERKMNALVTRMLPSWTGVGTVFSAPVATKNAADIICALALDQFIGDRAVSELDLANIYGIAGPTGAIATYFGSAAFAEFCYTLDDSKVSFEESIGQIAQAIFSVAYRRGNVLSLSFEQPTTNSVLLFNHRNKIPKSETRTVTFGSVNDNDGINLDYIEPNAPNYPNLDTTVTLYFPPNQSAKNPKKVTAVGVRNKAQALALGWRMYFKLIYQNTVVEFDATEETAMLVLQDRILVADNTRADTQDGEVIDQAVLLLTLSQDVVFDGIHAYTIFLQNEDGLVESIGITAGPNPNQVILAAPPTNPCVIDPDNFAKTTYSIVNNAPARTNVFLLTEKSPKDGKVYSVKAVNYAPEYYQNDLAGSGGGNPFSIFMPTTNGFDTHPGGTAGWGSYSVGPDYGELDQWTSRPLSRWDDRQLAFDFTTGTPMYAAPGSDQPGAPPRAELTGVVAVIVMSQNYHSGGASNWFDTGDVSWNNGSTYQQIGGTAENVATRHALDITAHLIAQFGSLAAVDFTQVKFTAQVDNSLFVDLLPDFMQFFIYQVGVLLLFNGAVDTGSAAGFGSSPSTGLTGFAFTPSQPLYQIDATHIGMVACTVTYYDTGKTVSLNARSWVIADPGATPQLYYVGIDDPTEVGDSLGTLTDVIGTTPAAANEGVQGWIQPPPILAIHGSSSNPPDGGSGNPGSPGTGNVDGGTIYRFPVTPALHGDFVLAHGLGVAPVDVRIIETSDGTIRFQASHNPPWDATNVYLNATDDGLTATIEVIV